MLLRKILRTLLSRGSRVNRKDIYRVEIDGERRLKVYNHGFFARITLNNFQSFLYWPLSSHFNDIYGKSRFMMNDQETNQGIIVLSPPKQVQGMKVLDKAAFKKQCRIPGIKIPNVSVDIINKKMKASMLRMPKLRAIADLDDADEDKGSHKLFLLNPEKYESIHDFTESERQLFEENGINLESFQEYNLELCYDNWNATDILKAVIPDPAVNISGFSIIGHIAHLNLKKEAMDYKYIIGEVLLDKNPVIKTVVNKTGEIDNTFRNFKMELLAGENNMMTQAKEHGFIFEFDFSKVYWNPRLATEHYRVINEVKPGNVVYDVFAGVGPFAIPAAKQRKGVVYANDLNPSSYESLCKNIKLNKVKTEVHCSNLDGRDFIKTVVKTDLIKRWSDRDNDTETNRNYKVVMNLPALAIEFTDAFISLFEDIDEEIKPTSKELLPYMYVYCFSKSETPQDDVRQRIENTIASPLPDDHIIRLVRNVAPNKDMLCICFHMPAEVLFGKNLEDDGPIGKKRKIDI